MKNKLNKFFRRCIPLLSVFMVVVASIPYSVHAVDLSWKDLIKDIDINNGTVTIQFPATPTTFDVYQYGDGTFEDVVHFNNVSSFTHHFSDYSVSDTTYAIQITPGSDSFLLLTNIPDNTELNVWLELTSVDLPIDGLAQPAWNFSVGRYNAHMYLFNEVRERIALRQMEFGEYYFPGQSDPMYSPEGNTNDTIGLFYASAILSDVLGNFEDNTEYFDNAHFFRASYFLENLQFNEHYDLRMSVRSYEMVLHLSDLLSGDGEYNELLSMILSSLERRGQTLDLITGEIIDLVNGTPDQQVSADKVLGSSGDSISDLGAASDALSKVPTPTVSSGDIIPGDVLASEGYLVLASTLSSFWESPTISLVCTILGGLIFISYLLFGEKG